MDTSPDPSHCPQCGAELPANAPQGLCPRCLLAGVDAPTDPGDPSVTSRPRPTVPSLTEIATAFPQLEIVDLIGYGGMGFVYKARQARLDRYVALKVLPQHLAGETGFRERFTREGRMLARLNHPNIVSVFDFGESGGFFYLLMEYVDGVNLRQAMRAGRFTLAQALTVVPEICGALSYAHGEAVLHRDIKPENILLDTRGRVKIADFGIAKLLGEADINLTATDARLGTPHYMAPEQIERPSEVDHRADIYSLGVVFYEMLTGELPLGHFKPPSEKSPLDPRVDEVVMRALAREKESRQQSAGEVKTQVENLSTAASSPAAEAAKGWQVRCLTCQKTTPLAETPGIRVDAVALGKRVLIDCSQCQKQRWAVVEEKNAARPAQPGQSTVASPRAAWSGKALLSGLLSIPTWLAAFLGTAFVAQEMVTRRSAGEWMPLLIAIILCLIPAGFAWFLGSRALKDPAVREGSKRGLRLAAVGTAALPTGLLQMLLFSAAGVLRPLAPAIGLLLMPLLFGMGLWFAVRQYQTATGRPAGHWPRRLALIFAVLFLVMLPSLCSRPSSSSPRRTRASAAPSAKGQLPQGAIDLVAVAPHPSVNQSWWNADGTPSTEGPFLNDGSRVNPQSDERGYEFVFRSRDLPAGASLPAWQFKPAANWAGGGSPALVTEAGKELPGYHLIAAALPRKARTVNIKAGVAMGAWDTVVSSDARGGLSTAVVKQGVNWNVSFGDPVETRESEIVVNVAHPRHIDWQTRLVAVNGGGDEVTPGRSSSLGEQTTARFTNLALSDIKEFRFQTRPYEWVEFRNIALQPATPARRR